MSPDPPSVPGPLMFQLENLRLRSKRQQAPQSFAKTPVQLKSLLVNSEVSEKMLN